MNDMKRQLVRENIKVHVLDWIHEAPGEFSVVDVDRDLDLVCYNERIVRTQVLECLVRDRKLERVGSRRGWYRPVDLSVSKINFMEANESCVDIFLLFGIHNMVETMPGNIIVVAGAPNAGKTAFLMNCAKFNRSNHNVHYFSSEMGGPEMKKRMKLYSDIALSDWNINAYSRDENFSDVIFPGKGNINIIDFLEIHDEFYKMGQYIKEIHRNLHGAVAIIGIQKNPNPKSDTGLGGQRSMEKARLALSMQGGKLKITKAKNWVNPKENPNGAEISYKLVNGAEFYATSNWTLKGVEKDEETNTV